MGRSYRLQRNAWFASAFNDVISKFTPTGSSASSFAVPASIGQHYVIDGLAVDGAGNVWVTSNNVNGQDSNADNLVFEYNNSGTLLSGTVGYAPSPSSVLPCSVVVDGSGNVW